MDYKIVINEELALDIVITARERTDILDRLEELMKDERRELLGYRGAEIVRLDGEGVYSFFVESGRVYALDDGGRWLVKERLYALEELFGDAFLKINQSCLVRVDKIERFRTTIGGALEVVLKNGYKDYVSRRQMKAVKERIGI